jgi:hypothetical protein
VNFTHRVRIMYKKQGHPDGSMPAPWRILAAKYALLHPAPLHQYSSKWIEENGKKILKIFERHREGGYQWKTSEVAQVNDEMRKMYKDGSGREAPEGDAGDQAVAEWWINENKEAVHDYAKNKNPSPQIKIVLRGNKAVSLAFRKQGKTFGWYTVHNVPVNIDEFRQHAEDNGYDAERHSRAILSYTRWKDILESPELKGKKPNPALDDVKQLDKDFKLKRTKLSSDGRGYIVPGHQQAELNPSDKYKEKYNNDPDFRKHVEQIIMNATRNALGERIGMDVRFNYSPDLQHKSSIRGGKSMQEFGVNDELLDDIFADVRQHLLALSGRMDWENDSQDDLDNFLRQKASSAARTAIKKKVASKQAKLSRAAGMGGPGDSKGGGDRHGGHEDNAANQGDSGDVATDPGASFTGARAGDVEGQEMGVDDLMHYIRSNPRSISSDKWIRTLIKKHAATDPRMKALADNLGLLGGDEGPSISMPGRSQARDYSPGVRVGESVRPFSFRDYLAIKLIREMEVVWGNDKASAKKIKPGETLKGGIQVQGAPWSAGGGPNKKGNDIKIKG